jgi:hypothetical protein
METRCPSLGTQWTRATGGHIRHLTHERGREITPIWSPDGGSIAYMAIPSKPPKNIRDEAPGSIKRIAISDPDAKPRTLIRDKVDVFPMAWQPAETGSAPADGLPHPRR